MATYRISQIVDSVVFVPYPITSGILTLRTLGGYDSRELLVVGEVDAPDYREAAATFDDHVFRALDAVSLQQKVATSAYAASSLVDRTDSPYVLLHAVTRHETTGTVLFDQAATDEVGRLDHALAAEDSHSAAVAFFRQSLLSVSPFDIGLHVLRAAEAIAGTAKRPRRCEGCKEELACAMCGAPSTYDATDRETLEKLMDADLYGYFYVKPAARHKIMHGRSVEAAELLPNVQALRTKVHTTLVRHYGIQHRPAFEDFKGIFRFDKMLLLLEPSGDTPPLPDLLLMFHRGELHSQSDPAYVSGAQVQNAIAGY